MGTASDTSRAAGNAKAKSDRKASRDRLEAVPGTVGDHAAIEHFLSVVLQRPTPQEFQAQLEDPFYEPTDRLLIKRGSQIAGHVCQSWRTMVYGPSSWPFCRLSYLAQLPEYGDQGLADCLIQTAEDLIAASGGMMIELADAASCIGNRDGWVWCSGDVYSEASPLDILAQLTEGEQRSRVGELLIAERRRVRRMSVRHWRHVELPALMRIYNANQPELYGALRRSEAYWRWLIGRRAFDQIFVAIEGRDRLTLEEEGCRIVGYAVKRGRHVLELMIEPGHPTAAVQLLARACADAIERDEHVVRLHAPPQHTLHVTMQDAGGTFHRYQREGNPALLVKLLRPQALVELLGPVFCARAAAAGLRLPVELGMQVAGKRWQLTLDADGCRVASGKLGRSYITCDIGTGTSLLLGYDHARAAAATGRLEASTALGTELAEALFPETPLWRPPWDHLPC